MQSNNEVSAPADGKAEVRRTRIAPNARRPSHAMIGIDIMKPLKARPQSRLEIFLAHDRARMEQAREGSDALKSIGQSSPEEIELSIQICIALRAKEIACLERGKLSSRQG